ncbi:MAG: DUF1360 domain-containing protein [Trueperaceae bacterium]
MIEHQVQHDQSSNRPVTAGYSEQPAPLGSYAGFLAAFGAGFLGFLAASRRLDRPLPERFSTQDVLLLGVATHKLTRIVTRDWVTSPLRAPFTSYEGSTGGGEVKERPRGRGFQRATGELLTCPWCFAPWTAAGLGYGLVLAPRGTRFVATLFAAVALSDYLQHGYNRVKQLSTSGK